MYLNEVLGQLHPNWWLEPQRHRILFFCRFTACGKVTWRSTGWTTEACSSIRFLSVTSLLDFLVLLQKLFFHEKSSSHFQIRRGISLVVLGVGCRGCLPCKSTVIIVSHSSNARWRMRRLLHEWLWVTSFPNGHYADCRPSNPKGPSRRDCRLRACLGKDRMKRSLHAKNPSVLGKSAEGRWTHFFWGYDAIGFVIAVFIFWSNLACYCIAKKIRKRGLCRLKRYFELGSFEFAAKHKK